MVVITGRLVSGAYASPEEFRSHRLIVFDLVRPVLIPVIRLRSLVPVWAEFDDVTLWPLTCAQYIF